MPGARGAGLQLGRDEGTSSVPVAPVCRHERCPDRRVLLCSLSHLVPLRGENLSHF